MKYAREGSEHGRIATIDIETTHWKPEQGETVSVGIGVHERGTPASEASYHSLHRDGSGEGTLIRNGIEKLNSLDADALVSFNGREFDLEFLRDRMGLLGGQHVSTPLDTDDRHTDLFADRKARCEVSGDKWPSLEECLESYGIPEPVTRWNGAKVDNTRFGDELGPAYLDAVSNADTERIESLQGVIEHYLVTDLEANIALYYADVGDVFEPAYLDSEKAF